MQGSPVVLVVDNEESVRLLLAALLERDSYKVLLAADGRTALQVSRAYTGTIDALITDYKMPELDGLQLARMIVSERPNVRVLVLSARISDPEIVRRAGFAFLAKPFTITGLMNSIRRCLTAQAGGN